jgi:hypothetical protein
VLAERRMSEGDRLNVVEQRACPLTRSIRRRQIEQAVGQRALRLAEPRAPSVTGESEQTDGGLQLGDGVGESAGTAQGLSEPEAGTGFELAMSVPEAGALELYQRRAS